MIILFSAVHQLCHYQSIVVAKLLHVVVPVDQI